ncbi:MAG: ComEC/Rec2 family competence protein [Alphaproteobacteria bacterium]
MAGAGARLGAWLSANLAAERERWLLWLPVGIGLGIALYFLFPWEPPLWPGLAAALAGAALVVAGTRGERGRPALVAAGFAAALMGVGVTVAAVRTIQVAAPILEKRLGPTQVRGRIAYLEELARGRRVILEQVSADGLARDATPATVRVRLSGDRPALNVGDWVAMRAVLRRPPAPAAPGAFDFQRHAFFQRIGAVGFSLGPARVDRPYAGQGAEVAPADERGIDAGVGDVAAGDLGAAGESWRLWLPGLRHEIATRVRASIGGAEGAVAAALMTGERGAIPERAIAAMRESGLAHLLAISGLHVGLVTGILFFSVRALLALVPAAALRFPIKKWAAVAALAGAFAYLAITGATVPTQRAFAMAALVLLAVVADRTAISMRVVAWAALIVLFLRPESLLGASFQMSFAAVVALVAVYEEVAGKGLAPGAPGRLRGPDDGDLIWRRRFGLYLAGIALTTIVASLATAPFVVYHFNRFAAYGLAANLAAVPITALWIMPWAMAAFLLMPFGLEAVALTPMGWGVGAVIAVAQVVSSWPGAVVRVSAMPVSGIALVALGGLWLGLWRRRWRFLGLGLILAGLASVPLSRPPDVLVDGDAKLVAVRGEDGALTLSSTRKGKFRGQVWLRRVGQEEAAAWPWGGASPDGRLACDALGCIYGARGQTVAIVHDGRALAEDCGTAEVVVSLVPVRVPCASPRRVIDRFDLWREGGHAVWLDPDDVRVETVRAWQGRRPWTADRGW